MIDFTKKTFENYFFVRKKRKQIPCGWKLFAYFLIALLIAGIILAIVLPLVMKQSKLFNYFLIEILFINDFYSSNKHNDRYVLFYVTYFIKYFYFYFYSSSNNYTDADLQFKYS